MMKTIALLAMLGCGHPAAPATPSDRAALPPWLLGTWTRDSVETTGEPWPEMAVHYLQTPALFGDVRVPPDRPTASSFAELTDAQLAVLARQRGFFGHTTIDGARVTWHHELDFQPTKSGGGDDDVGRVEQVDGGMKEHALDESYVEHWRRIADGDPRFLALRITRDGRLERMVLVAGDRFAYARNRARELPAADSLEELLSKVPRDELIAALDCELSYGRVTGGRVPWEIENLDAAMARAHAARARAPAGCTGRNQDRLDRHARRPCDPLAHSAPPATFA